MFLKKLKKGFTIVELVIVIAVIAVLAAVLIPTFTNMIKEAKVSSDTTLVKNLNTALVTDEAINGTPATMQDALDAVNEYGYSVDKLTPTSNGDIVWDSASNRFALVNDKGESIFKDSATTATTGIAVWKITDTVPTETENTYSYYLTACSQDTITVATGIDLSGIETPVNVNYTNDGTEQAATLNLNGGSLTVNAPNDTVNVYGDSTDVTAEAVADNSLHIFATVTGNVSISQGRVVIEASASVAAVVVLNTEKVTEVAIDVSAKVGGLAFSSAEKGEVTISGTVEVQYNYDSAASVFAGGLGTEKSPYLISNFAQLKAIDGFFTASSTATFKQMDYKYFKLIDNIELENSYIKGPSTDYCFIKFFNGEIDGNNKSLIVPDNGGDTNTWYQLIDYAYNATIKDLNMYLPEVGRFTLISNCFHMDYGTVDGDITFENVTTYNRGDSSPLHSNYGALITNSHAKNLTIKDCNNYANLDGSTTGQNSGAVWVGQFNVTSKIKVQYINCNNYGNVVGATVGLFMGNAKYNQSYSYSDTYIDNLVISNCHNYGTVIGSSSGTFFGSGSTGFSLFANYNTAGINQGLSAMVTTLSKTSSLASLGEDNSITINTGAIAGSVKYAITYGVGIQYWETSSQELHTRTSLSVEYTASGSAVSTGDYKASIIFKYEFDEMFEGATLTNAKTDASGTQYWIYIDSATGNVYYVINDKYSEGYLFNTYGTTSVTVYAYDESGNVIGYTSL